MQNDVFLVTGCTGALGKRISLKLLSKGYKVDGIFHKNQCSIENENHKCIQGNLLESEFLDNLDLNPYSHLVHTSWNVTSNKFWDSEENHTWLEMSIKLFTNFKKAGGQKISSIGSCAEYEWDNNTALSEESPCVPSTKYGVSKTQLLQQLKNLNIEYSWFRVFFLYGVSLRTDKYFGYLRDSYLNNRSPIVTDPYSKLDYVHVDDASDAIAEIVTRSESGIYNICSGKAVTNMEIAEYFQILYGSNEAPTLNSKLSEERVVIGDKSLLQGQYPLYNARELYVGLMEYTDKSREY